MFQFVRKLKLREYFHDLEDVQAPPPAAVPESSEPGSGDDSESERDPSRWKERNPSWYPDAVRSNRSEGLTRWIDNMLDFMNGELSMNKQKLFNNLTAEQRSALKTLAADESITIKPADKGGALVIMDTVDYEAACKKMLNNRIHYKEIQQDPTPRIVEEVAKVSNEMYNQHLVTEFERDTLIKGSRTPLFYGLPKIHKFFDIFPSLRPICSGSDGPTVYLSELIDTFLKPLARKSASYLRDSTDFINKTQSLILPNNPILVTMDVEALYPNIDQAEGASACEEVLNSRRNMSFPTDLLKRLILLVLQSNCMRFGNQFFQQVKGTAMGTPMAVSFANIFMTKFECSMLDNYEREHQRRPHLWLRFIDDVFFVWSGDESSLKHFIDYCNNYSTQQGMQSTIRFTTSYSRTDVSFLDMKVSLKNNKICTSLHSKTVDTHTYLHSTSFHSRSTILSLPKTQFIRIRRLCSTLSDYQFHAQKFLDFFIRRGYKKHLLQKQIREVADMPRQELLTVKPKLMPDDHPSRTVLSIAWHPRLQFLQRALHSSYKRFSTQYATLKDVFPEPPLVAFRRNRTLRDTLVHARQCGKGQPAFSLKKSSSMLQKNMATSTSLTNEKEDVSVKTAGGNTSDRNVIYAAKCKKCQLIYVGYTTQPLNERFNIHRSDVTNHPDRSELPGHFHYTDGCDFERDLEVHVLQKMTCSSRAIMEAAEDKWILRLKTLSPSGLNSRYNEYGVIHRKLFS